jgi:hypothetical protein
VSSLVDMPRARSVIMGPVTHRVCGSDSAYEATERSVSVWTRDEMSVSGRQPVTAERDIISIHPFRKDSLERGIIFRRVKNRLTPVASIQGMVQSAGFIRSWWSWHDEYRNTTSPETQ